MKAIILAGGTGSRLYPLTKATNKNLLPVGKKPIIQHCIEQLTSANIQDILVISGVESFGILAQFLGSGKDFNCDITLRVQDEPKGIAHGIGLAKDFCSNTDKFCVLLGDNLFQHPLTSYIEEFKKQEEGARVLFKKFTDLEKLQKYGVPAFELDGRIKGIDEKPKIPKSYYCVTGFYMYDQNAFDIINTLKPSPPPRNELEVSDLNTCYIKKNRLWYSTIKGWWLDVGSFETLHEANIKMKDL